MSIAEVDLTQDGTVENPINREPSMKELVTRWAKSTPQGQPNTNFSSFLTQSDNYDRNHGPIQHRIATDHIITIDGLISNPTKLSAPQLISKYSQHRVSAALQCAGNRRHTMRTQIKEVSGVDWFDAAVMNCVWEGPRLRDVLLSAGVDGPLEASRNNDHVNGNKQEFHVQFASYGTKTQEDEWYGGSIPLERAMDPDMDVILAVKMNNKPLPARHGFPVRVIVPGALGARSVKWLDRITISTQESPNVYQQRDYKILPPEVTSMDAAKQYWEKLPSMLDMPINACVAFPIYDTTVRLDKNGKVRVAGYAVPAGADGPVVRVQVSGDEGRTWVDAELDHGPEDVRSRWTWVLWEAEISICRGVGRKIYAKATDQAGNTQMEPRSQWNLRGVAYNGYEAVWGLAVI